MRLAVSPYEAPSLSHQYGPFGKMFNSFTNPVDDGINGCDALILWGGRDIHPSFYGQKPHIRNQINYGEPVSQRDIEEWHLMHEEKKYGIPIIGICRGAQFLCVFAGGKLIQDVTHHRCGHEIITWDGKTLHAPAEHHQMMNIEGVKEFRMLGWTEPKSSYYEDEFGKVTRSINVDPEVVYFPRIKGFAIQPHPEWGPVGTEFNNWLTQQMETILFTSSCEV